jgi:hypothetical protein
VDTTNIKLYREGSDERKTESFVPGGIHTKESIQFWRNTLQAGEWVLDVLENGYSMPLEGTPPAYEERNNGSARQHKVFVRETVLQKAKEGIVHLVDDKPHCVSPLSVVSKVSPTGVEKLRLCWDGSRCVNQYLKEQKVTLAHFHRALELTHQGDFQIKIRFKISLSPYSHGPTTDKIPGGSFRKRGWGVAVFCFSVLSFWSGISGTLHHQIVQAN